MQRILHLEGNSRWIPLCRDAYRKSAFTFSVFPVTEEAQADFLSYILPLYHPSFLVLTGHDRSYGDSSLHTSDFVHAVHMARQWNPDPAQLFIFAGACGSHAESILKAGANFASSPGHIPISVLDPVFLILSAASKPPGEWIEPSQIISATLCGSSGITGTAFRVPMI